MLYYKNKCRYLCTKTDMTLNNFHDRNLCHKYLHKRQNMKSLRIRLYKMFCNFSHTLQNMKNYNRPYIPYHNFLYN